MKRKVFWTSLSVALIVAGITVAWTETQPWHAGRGPFWFHHGPMGYVANELDLSDTQKSQIKSIWEGERPNVGAILRELASEQKEMDALTFQGNAPDDGRMQDIAARQGATLGRLFVEKEELTDKIYSQVLTPAQRTKADELRKRWDSRLDEIANRIGNTTGTR